VVGGSNGKGGQNSHCNSSSNTTVVAAGQVAREMLWHGRGILVADVAEGASAGGG